MHATLCRKTFAITLHSRVLSSLSRTQDTCVEIEQAYYPSQTPYLSLSQNAGTGAREHKGRNALSGCNPMKPPEGYDKAELSQEGGMTREVPSLRLPSEC